jgi:ABC-type spermidine/putrescine transport system permease subunit II
LARKNFKGKALIEDIVTLPLVFPTSAFGFTTLITWTTVSGLGGLIGRGLIDINFRVPFIDVPFLLIIVHTGLTFSYIVRTLRAKFEDLEIEFEQASRVLGATSLTTFRKVMLPLSLPGVLHGSVLAFARSLGETGATMVVAGVYDTAPLSIVRWTFQFEVATASFLGLLLIAIACGVILPAEYLVQRRKFYKPPGIVSASSTIERKVLKTERFASKKLPWLKDVFSFVIVGLIVVVPIIVVMNYTCYYWTQDPYTGRLEAGVVYQLFGPSNYFAILSRATLTSIVAAFASTYIATCIAIPSTYIIEWCSYGRIIRALLKVPLIAPTSALGLSALIFWGPAGVNLIRPGVWLIILTHIVFSVPIVLEPTLAAFEGWGAQRIKTCEEAARTLGANPYDAIETISLPMLKRGVLAGATLSFAHSLGETGATFMVMGSDITVPPLVVNMAEAQKLAAASFASMFLIILSLVLLFIFRLITRKQH